MGYEFLFADTLVAHNLSSWIARPHREKCFWKGFQTSFARQTKWEKVRVTMQIDKSNDIEGVLRTLDKRNE